MYRVKRLVDSTLSAIKEQPIRYEYGNGLHIEYRLPSNNNRHNENGPAYILYYSNGNKEYEGYWINNNRHNENGPASISYYPNGKKRYERYYINNRLHNENGPAFIGYYDNGKKRYEGYYINDKFYSLQEFITHLLTNKIKSKSSEQIANFIETEGINNDNYYAVADYLEENGYSEVADYLRRKYGK